MNSLTIYRISEFLYKHNYFILSRIVDRINFILFNSFIPGSAKIGKFSKCAYGGIGVVIHSKAIIGERVIVGQGVTIGKKKKSDEAPSIGNNVYLSAGCRILGSIKIGDNVIVGANAVVINDVPSNCVVAGVPARIIRYVDYDIHVELENEI